ncbi:MAG: phosphatase [Gammaproteobacteria bacterium]|nr:MAG: phosphatase [Gammaproteobacteria bacterium]
MQTPDEIPQYNKQHYAVVDLGSNSFHLLITCLHHNKIETVNKVKRKVRLAAGLNEHNELSLDAIERGLDCLRLFAKHLASIPPNNIRIVATATLRIAKNRDAFINQANEILPLDLKLLSGEQEATTIYSGVAHTCGNNLKQKRLVLDIGGASTELIVGQGFTANNAVSLNLGCVSFREKYFVAGQFTHENFATAIDIASSIIEPYCADFINFGWQVVVGGSGTMQALAEILTFRQQAVVIKIDFLLEIKAALIHCKTLDAISRENSFFAGLRLDRAPVLASGLSILIALFNCLAIKELELSSGALREGLLFEMLPKHTNTGN